MNVGGGVISMGLGWGGLVTRIGLELRRGYHVDGVGVTNSCDIHGVGNDLVSRISWAGLSLK